MRLFTGVDLPEDVLDSLARLLDRLRPAARIRWSPPKNLHITTKFIGAWPGERMDELVGVLGAMEPPGEIPIAIRGLGWFPNARAPRVLYAGIDAGDGLARLATETDQSVARLGVEQERREFRPHLTLGRIRKPTELAALREAVQRLPSTEFGAFTARRFFLYESQLNPTGSVYTKLAGFPLAP